MLNNTPDVLSLKVINIYYKPDVRQSKTMHGKINYFYND